MRGVLAEAHEEGKVITEVNEALNKKLVGQQEKIDALKAEVQSLLEQREHLVEEARSFRAIRKKLHAPRSLFLGGDFLRGLHEVVHQEDNRAQRREWLVREAKRLAKEEKEDA